MKRFSKMLILLCVLAVCVGGYYLVTNLTGKETQTSNETTATVALTTHAQDELSALSWSTTDGSTIRFTKNDAGWHYDQDSAFPVNQSTMDTLAEKLCALTANRSIDNVSDSSIYGFTEPAFEITAEWSDGKTSTYTMGDATAFADGYYVMLSGDDKVYTVSTSLATTFQKTLNSLAVKEDLPDVDNVSAVSVNDVQATYLEVSTTINTDQHWVDQDGTVLDTTSVTKLISSIQSLAWDELVTGSASDSELESYGLKDAAKEISIGNPDGDQLILLIGSQNSEGDYYAKLPDSKMVYTLAQADAEAVLSGTHDSLKAENVLLTLPYEDVDAALFTYADREYRLETANQNPAAKEAATAETTSAETTSAETSSAETASEETASAETSSEETASAETASSETASSETASDTEVGTDAGTEAEEAAEEAVDSTEDDKALWAQLIGITAAGSAESKQGEILLTVSITNVNGITAELVIREYDADHYSANLDGSGEVLVSADKVDKLIRMLKQML